MAQRNFFHRTAALLILLGLAAACTFAQSTAHKPITKNGLIEALKLGGLSATELVGFVEKRGVDFHVNSAVDQELRTAGAAPELIQAVKANYRSPAPGDSQPPPVAPTPAPAPESPPPPPNTVQTPARAPPPPNVTTRAAVKKVYIDKMPNDLDQYLRAEITKQLPGRLLVVLNRDDADAIMTGVGDSKSGTGAVITGRYLGLHDNATGAVSIVDKSGTVVIWSSEAGDRSLLMGAVKRGGPRKVADRLIHNLKKALGN